MNILLLLSLLFNITLGNIIYYVVCYLLLLPGSHTLCFLDSHTLFYRR